MPERPALGVVLIALLGALRLVVPDLPVPERVVHLSGPGLTAGWYGADSLAWAAILAGGAPPRLAGAPVHDGDHLVLHDGWLLSEQAPAPAGFRTFRRAININRASQADLEALPGVGPVLAGRILAARPYRSLADLDAVKGIGPATLKKLQPWVRFE